MEQASYSKTLLEGRVQHVHGPSVAHIFVARSAVAIGNAPVCVEVPESPAGVLVRR